MMYSKRRLFFLAAAIIAIAVGAAATHSSAQTQAQSPPVAAPSFWDPAERLERPDLSDLRAIRFLTDDDYPPLNFALADGTLAGFNIDIARAVCGELQIACTIQARRWDTLLDALTTGKGDAVIASLAMTAATHAEVDFTLPYYETPARFVAARDAKIGDLSLAESKGTVVGVVSGSAHEAYLGAFFANLRLKTFPDLAALEEALRSRAIEVAFADGLTLSVWLSGEASQDCCRFIGGPYLESRFFGQGVGIAVRKDDGELRRALDWALARLASRGAYAEIYQKYFPVNFY
jgi:polar amino acid transport system substrate-binding protein